MNYIRNDKTEIKFITLLEDKKNATIFKHFKNMEYSIITIAKNTEDESDMVIYKALYGDFRVFARETNVFFSLVDKHKYPDVLQKYRFEVK